MKYINAYMFDRTFVQEIECEIDKLTLALWLQVYAKVSLLSADERHSEIL